MNPLYPEVAARAMHRCEYCHAPEAVFNFPFEVEHIAPVSRGGVKSKINGALACRACNLRKAAHVTGTDPEISAEVRLFNPREDSWDDHFHADPESGTIEGLTPIGRGTVIRLEMNSEAQVAARRQWIRLGIFP
jgi:hypothetical protein